jgi:multiple sugar transport system substrate-binding protein
MPPADKYKGQKLAMISRQEYFKDTETTVDAQLQGIAKALNITITNDHVNEDTGEIVAKQDAAIKSNNSVDMAYLDRFVSQFVQLNDLEDVSDVVEELQKAYGPVEDVARIALTFNGKWYGIPFFTNAGGYFARKDWLAEKNIDPKSVKTWENMRDAAFAISDPSKNRFGWGFTVNKSGDGNGVIQDCMHAYGASVASDDGKKVVFNSPETLAAITFLADIYTNPKWKNMLPPGVNGWTDTSNNEAWLAGTIGFTSNAYTLYAKSFADKNPVYNNTIIFPPAIGPGADKPVQVGGPGYFLIFKGSKNVALAKDVAKQMVANAQFLAISKTSLGLIMPAYKNLWTQDPFYTQGDPAFPALRQVIEAELPIPTKTGFHFPQTPSPGADAAVNSQYVLTDMMGDIILKGVKVPDAIKTANDRIVQAFEQLGLKQ